MRAISFRLSAVATCLAVLTFASAGCNRRAVPEAAAAVQTRLAGASPMIGSPHEALVWKDVHEFYLRREGGPGWIDQLKPSKQAKAGVELLSSATQHGLSPADYQSEELSQQLAALEQDSERTPERLQQLAEFDVRLTTALLTLGRDVAIGRTSPQRLSADWKARRTTPDLVGTLNDGVHGDLNDWLATVSPHHPEYAALQKALAGLRATGTGDTTATESASYDLKTKAGISAFQEHHGLTATGVADTATRAAASVPLTERIDQVASNLERWRWMPDDFGAAHLFVNIPLYQVLIRENNTVVEDIRVVVGKTDHETPVFSGEMDTVVFSPYWNIPDSIAQSETGPRMSKDPQYLARNDIEVFRVTDKGTETVSPASVDWDDQNELSQLAFRQKPGAQNALGQVKFLFPNAFNVYLHDSPAEELFARVGRAFSHGCVRVEEPETLARYVLRDQPEWTTDTINEAMNAGVEKHVALKTPLPVHITYFTAWVDDNGGLHFQPDVYGYDAKQRAER